MPRPFLVCAAVLLCAAAIAYTVVWMRNVRSWTTVVELGFNHINNEEYDKVTHSVAVGDVVAGSPAEQAGLRAGDKIVGVNGRALDTSAPYDEAYARGRPGDPVELTIARPGEPDTIVLHGIFRLRASFRETEGLARSSIKQIEESLPVLFLLVGFGVLFLRLDDPSAWLLAFLFTAFAAVPDIENPIALPESMRGFTFAYRAVWDGMLCSLFYVFFAVFPACSPLNRRFPWLKWVALLLGAITVLPGLLNGRPNFPAWAANLIGQRGSEVFLLSAKYGLIGLGMVSLAQNAFLSSTPSESRRKSRVIFWGIIVAVLPIVLVRAAKDFTGYESPYWVNAAAVVVFFLYPLSFAYAIIKHRVLEIPVLLRRSARYLLVQRGYFVLLFCAALLTIYLFTHFFSGLFVENSQIGMVLSAAFGVAMVWVSGPFVKRGTDRIDRAFFRSSYDTRMILQDLGEKARTVTGRHDLANLLELHIQNALHPESLSCYLENVDGNSPVEPASASRVLTVIPSNLPQLRFPFWSGAGFVFRAAATISASDPFLMNLAQHGKAWDVPPPEDNEAPAEAALRPECLVPIVGRDSNLMGMLVLGPRLSEEPYSSEDKRLLESVAGQAAISLENMRMAEQMADRLERDRRAEHEMQIAREVQKRLFPQVMPRLATLEYAGDCIQARQVGGDYYDFWDFGAKHLALVLADISGKGISGALLMANLQANLRSRLAVARQDMLNLDREGKWLPGLLKSVNQLFYENTPDDRYATLFLAVYDDSSRQLEYANCGHNPPLLLRASGEVEHLQSTATVIGLTPNWECSTEIVTLRPNDVLIIYTDGVTEANDAQGNEFGEQRLEAVVRKNFTASPAELLAAIPDAVEKFSVGEQFDDLTLVVARAR